VSDLLTVTQAQAMGFDAAQIEDLLDQGLISDARPVTWRPETLADLNWLVGKSRSYDAEEARLTEQYQRRLKALAQRRTWLSRYDDDCAALLADTLPKKADGTYQRKSLDLEDGRVKLVKKGGGLEVDEERFLDFARKTLTSPAGTPVDNALFSAIRAVRTEVNAGVAALVRLTGPSSAEWKASVLKTPIADYLKEHPNADLPGVSEVPVSQVFEIERKGGAL